MATEWLESVSDIGSIAICRVVQMGALRILTRPSIMGEYVLSGAQAWMAVTRFMEDDRFAFAAEPGILMESWRIICNSLPTGMSAETDAYLAAFALAGGYRLVTLDKGMVRFHGIELVLLRS
jgi:uncharacterized protein